MHHRRLGTYHQWLKYCVQVLLLMSCISCSPASVGFSPQQATRTTPQPSQPVGQGGNTDPLISRGKPVYCSPNNTGPAGAIVNGHYASWSNWDALQSTLPTWCAIHVGAGFDRVLFVWENCYTTAYVNDHGSTPLEYTISISADSTDGADGTWQTVVSVTGNQAFAREHLLSFAGQSWVKMTITKGQAQVNTQDIAINQIDVYDISAGPKDTFFFSGDSITASAYNRADEHQPAFADLVHAAFPKRFPAMIDGGFGNWTSSAAVQNIDLWLALNPDMHYWLLEWGTNDTFGQESPKLFQANLQTLVNRIKTAGHVPILVHIPYVNRPGDDGIKVDKEIQLLNAVIDRVTAKNGLIQGPDLYQLFREKPSVYLLPDNTHPSPAGVLAMNRAWFETLRPHIFK